MRTVSLPQSIIAYKKNHTRMAILTLNISIPYHIEFN